MKGFDSLLIPMMSQPYGDPENVRDDEPIVVTEWEDEDENEAPFV